MKRRDWEDPQSMLSVDDAFRRVISRFAPLDQVSIPLLEALGLTVASDVQATVDVPPFRNSAMDGYAIHAADTEGATDQTPVSLDVVATIAAGDNPSFELRRGSAARIMTGGMLPSGADSVVRFEEISQDDGRDASAASRFVQVQREVAPNENVREPGEDFRAASLAITAGTVLGPPEIGILASLNIPMVPVHRRPVVAILSTGDEVQDLGDVDRPGKIRDANSYALAAMVMALGAVPKRLGIARDRADDLRRLLAASADYDLIVTSGGVSHGDFDLVKDVLRADGLVDLWTVRMKPGKPLAFGRIGQTPLLGLPGNPAAALVSFEQFGRPAILKMLGRTMLTLPEIQARLAVPLINRGGRRHFERGVLTVQDGQYVVSNAGKPGSAMLSAMAASNCYIVVPEDRTRLDEGEIVTVQLRDQPGRFAGQFAPGALIPGTSKGES